MDEGGEDDNEEENRKEEKEKGLGLEETFIVEMIPWFDVVVIVDAFCDFAAEFIKIVAVLKNEIYFQIGQKKHNRSQRINVVNFAGSSGENHIRMWREGNQRND